MTEKESEKVKKRTGKLLSSFVVLTIVLSVLAASVTSVSAEDFDDIIVTADPSVIYADGGTSTSTITATLIKDGSPVAKQGQAVIFDLVDDSKGAELNTGAPVLKYTNETGKACTTLTAGFETGVVTIEARAPIPAGAVTNTTQVTLSGPPEVTRIVVSPPEKTLIVGGTQQFIATAYSQYPEPDDVMPDVEFTWTSSNETVGTVTETGFFEALALGHTFVNATNASIVGSASVTVIEYKPDLNVTEITPKCDYLFANESNEICAVIENIGPADAGAFNVSFVVGGFSEKVEVSGLAAGASTTRCVIDPTLRNAGDLVTITVTADCDGEIIELNEANNATVQAETVVNNGYKGKTYTGGENITTLQTHTLNGSVLYSVGDSHYLSGATTSWTQYIANWTASDLPVPGAATIEKARLYVYYTWDKVQGMPDNVSMEFNDNPVTIDAFYTDRKGYGTWDFPFGMLAYDVTTYFNASGNNAILENLNPVAGNPSIQGMLLVVIYADATEPERTIWINEECDILAAKSSYCTTPEEATAYAPFAGTIEDIANKSAKLITVAPSASAGDDENRLYFNDQVWNGVWDHYVGATELGIAETDVSDDLKSSDNIAKFQDNGDWMEASNAILLVEEKPPVTEYNVTLELGWNMIGVPLDLSNYTLPEPLSSIEGKYTDIAYYNATSGEYQSYTVGWEAFATLKELEPGAGYWINMTESSILTFEGNKFVELSRDLESEWNMFSVPYGIENETLPSVVESIEGDYTDIAYYNATSGEYQSYTVGWEAFATLKELEPGAGYWINMTSPATFVASII